MKVAVCFSGQCGGSVSRNIETFRYHFGCDLFYGTWADKARDIEQQIPGAPFLSIPVVNMHYHPIVDVLVEESNRALHAEIMRIREIALSDRSGRAFVKGWHRTKQILAHASMLSALPAEYDMVIRARFDTRLSRMVDFGPYLGKSYNERRAVGFGKALGVGWIGDRANYSFDRLRDSDAPPPNYLCDFMIMHRRDMFDVAAVWGLHEAKRLLPAEIGWWQVLSKQHGDNHLNVVGGAALERFERY